MTDWPTLPADAGYPLVNTASGEFLSELIRARLAADIGVAARGPAGRRYRMILGAIRNTGSGFSIIQDAAHRPTFIDSVSNTTQGIVVNYPNLGTTRVAGLVVVPDETFAAAGFHCGASVGLESATIYVYKDPAPVTGYIAWNGSSFVVTGGDGVTGTGALGGTHPGEVAITHDVVTGFGATLTPRGPKYDMCIGAVGSMGTDRTFASFIDRATGLVATVPDTDMRFTITRHGRPRKLIDPNVLNTTNYPFSNFWIIGVMESTE